MFSNLRTFTFVLLCLSLLSVSCSKKSTSQAVPDVSGYAVTCIAVLPAMTPYDFEGDMPAPQEKELNEGVHVLDRLLKQHFINRTDVRLVSDSQIFGMDEDLPAQPLARAKMVADRLSCNSVLETTLRRYRERVGGKYTADEPASVAFDYRLVAVPDGKVLCKGTFDEVQKSLMENLYNFKTASERGFTWVTAEQLMKDGVQTRFSECLYFTDDE